MWNTASRNLLGFVRLSKPPTVISHRLLQTSSCLHTQQNTYPLPWPKTLKPVNPYASIWDRMAGLFLLNRLVDFSRSDFLLGVTDAVYSIAEIFSDQSRHIELERLMNRPLYSAVKQSLDSLPTDSNIHLDIESIRHLQLCTVHSEVGEAATDDVFAVRILGQEIVSSEAKLQSYSESILRGSKEERLEARESVLTMKAKFELGVGFSTREKYIVFTSEGKVVEGSNQYQTCHHLWKFSSPVDSESDNYPLEWTISDINGYLD